MFIEGLRYAKARLANALHLPPAEDDGKDIDREVAAIQNLVDDHAAALAREAAILQFCEVEMGWEFFRAEFQIGDHPSKSLQNAKKLREFLAAHTS